MCHQHAWAITSCLYQFPSIHKYPFIASPLSVGRVSDWYNVYVRLVQLSLEYRLITTPISNCDRSRCLIGNMRCDAIIHVTPKFQRSLHKLHIGILDLSDKMWSAYMRLYRTTIFKEFTNELLCHLLDHLQAIICSTTTH